MSVDKWQNFSPDPTEEFDSIQGTLATLNLGPTHPATHGIFQNVLKMDGEKIYHSEQTIGYIHRAFEKLAERRPFNQITPITDRMNYCSAPINNIGACCRKIGRNQDHQTHRLYAGNHHGISPYLRPPNLQFNHRRRHRSTDRIYVYIPDARAHL